MERRDRSLSDGQDGSGDGVAKQVLVSATDMTAASVGRVTHTAMDRIDLKFLPVTASAPRLLIIT